MRERSDERAWRGAFWHAIGQALAAHIIMLRDVDIIDDPGAAALLDAVDGVRRGTPPEQGGSLVLVAAFDERCDSQTAPGAVGGSRLGRSAFDMAATAQRLVLRERALALLSSQLEARAALLDFADEHVFSLMNAWSGSVPMQPTTVAHFLTGTTAPLARAGRRLREACTAMDRSPLGAAALVGPGLAIDREETADLLGCEGAIESTFDALAASDHLVTLSEAARATASPLGRLFRELLLWTRADPRAIRFADELMAAEDASLPGFRRPRSVEALLATAQGAARNAAAVAELAADLPYGPTGELGDAATSWTDMALRDAADVAAAASMLLRGPIEINRAWLARNAGRDLVTTGDLSLLLMAEEGLDPAAAEAIAALATNRARQEEREASGIGPEMIDAAALLVVGRELGIEIERLGAYLAPRRFIEKRTHLGGPAAPAIREYLAVERTWFEADRQWLETTQRRLDLARENLEIRTREIRAAAVA